MIIGRGAFVLGSCSDRVGSSRLSHEEAFVSGFDFGFKPTRQSDTANNLFDWGF